MFFIGNLTFERLAIKCRAIPKESTYMERILKLKTMTRGLANL